MTNETKRSLRTALQTAVGLAVALPLIFAEAGVPDSWPLAVTALAVAGGFARVMALPAVQNLLPGWLRTDEPGQSG